MVQNGAAKLDGKKADEASRVYRERMAILWVVQDLVNFPPSLHQVPSIKRTFYVLTVGSLIDYHKGIASNVRNNLICSENSPRGVEHLSSFLFVSIILELSSSVSECPPGYKI